jgi:hypothetical protein
MSLTRADIGLDFQKKLDKLDFAGNIWVTKPNALRLALHTYIEYRNHTLAGHFPLDVWFLLFNLAMWQSILPTKRWLVCQNARSKENPNQKDLTGKGGYPQRYFSVIPSPAALSPGGWAARCSYG